MSLIDSLKALFGGSEPEPGDVYRDGHRIPCEACGKRLRVKYYPPKEITLGGPDAVRGIALKCQHCGFITCIDCAMKPLAGKMQACPSCKKELGPTILTQGVDQLRRKAEPAGNDGQSSKSSNSSQWTPVNPRVSSGMPFSALEQIFVFTNGNGNSALDSQVTSGMLQDAAMMPLDAIFGKVSMDVIGQSNVAPLIIEQGTIPESGWLAMGAIKPTFTQQAQDGLYRACVRPFPTESGEQVAIVLLYNKQKL